MTPNPQTNVENLRNINSSLAKRLDIRGPLSKYDSYFHDLGLRCLKDGFPPQDILYWAGKTKNQSILFDLCMFYQDKINLNEPMFEHHQTIMHIAAREGEALALSSCISVGADLCLKDDKGNRPIDYARRKLEIVERVVEEDNARGDIFSKSHEIKEMCDTALKLLERATAEQEKRGYPVIHPVLQQSPTSPEEYLQTSIGIPIQLRFKLPAYFVLASIALMVGLKCCTSLSKPPERVQKAVPVMSMSKQQENGGYERQN